MSRVVRPAVVAVAVIAVTPSSASGSLDYPATTFSPRPQEIRSSACRASFAIVLAALVATGVLVRFAWLPVALITVGGLVSAYVFRSSWVRPPLSGQAALATAAFVIEARHRAPDREQCRRNVRLTCARRSTRVFGRRGASTPPPATPRSRGWAIGCCRIPYGAGGPVVAALAALVAGLRSVRWIHLGMTASAWRCWPTL
jgi:hypothetical protein